MSLPQTIAVQPLSSRAPAAAWPPSTLNSVWWMSSWASSGVTPSRSVMAAVKPSIFRSTGTNRRWPTARPIRSWPSSTRCWTAIHIAARSSGEMNGAAIFSL